jgi:hypothetical protein
MMCGDITCSDHAHCEDGAAGAECVCDEGYEGADCDDIDECAQDLDNCDEHATCENAPGTFSCECKVGYEGSGDSCTPNPCEPRANPCDTDTTTCHDEAGEAVCDCLEGRDRCDHDAHACNTDLQGDADNCGECGFECAGNLGCAQGACEQALVELSLGTRHSCGLTAAGETLCWGANDMEQLLRSESSTPTYEPAPVMIGPAKLLDVGADFSCALLKNADLVCWGSNQVGQIVPGDPPRRAGLFAVSTGYSRIRQLSSGMLSTCILLEDAIDCWGDSLAQELGTSVTSLNFEARNTLPLEDPTSVSNGTYLACAVGGDKHLRCWGQGNASPREIVDGASTPLTNVSSVSTGYAAFSGCAVRDDAGRVVCWGANASGQLGNIGVTTSSVTYAVSVLDESSVPLSSVLEVGYGSAHACALRNDGTVACWGRRDLLGTGVSGTTPQRSFLLVNGVDDAVDLAVGAEHTCIRR